MKKSFLFIGSILFFLFSVLPAFADRIDDLARQAMSTDREVYRASIKKLSEIGTPKAVNAMIKVLKTHSDPWARSEPINYLEKYPLAMHPIMDAIKDPAANVRSSAALALAYYKDPQVMKPLIDALRDENQDVRFAAATAIRQLATYRKIKDDDAALALLPLLQDKSDMVREAAVKAMQCYGGLFAVQSMIAKKKITPAQATTGIAKAAPAQQKKTLKAVDLVGIWRVNSENINMPNLKAILTAEGDWLFFNRVGNVTKADNSTLIKLRLKGNVFEESSYRDAGTRFGQGSTRDCAGKGSDGSYDVQVKGKVSEDGRKIILYARYRVYQAQCSTGYEWWEIIYTPFL